MPFNKIVLYFLFSLLANSVLAQDLLDDKANQYQAQIQYSLEHSDFETSFNYLDSLAYLSTDYYWEAVLLRARTYTYIFDSMAVADQLLDQYIRHTYEIGDIPNRLAAYDIKQYTLGTLYQFQASVDTIGQAIELAKSIQDTSYLIHYTELLGFLYVNVLLDADNASEYLKQCLSLSLESKNWPKATSVLETLVECYQVSGDTSSSQETAELALKYALNIDSSNALRYYGYIIRGKYHASVRAYDAAIEDALVAHRKADQLDDVNLLVNSSTLLTEAYYKKGLVDRAYHYAQIVLSFTVEEYQLIYFYYYYSQICAAKKLHKEALVYLKKYNAHQKGNQDENLIQSSAKAMLDGGIKRNELELSNTQLNLELAQSQATFRAYILGFVLMFLLLGIGGTIVLYRKNQHKKQLNQALLGSNEVVKRQKELLHSDLEQLQETIILQESSQEEDLSYTCQSGVQINYKDILYLESSNNYVLIHCSNQSTPLLERIKMNQLIADFPATTFARTHRSYAVNLNHIVARPSKYVIVMSNEVSLKLSRTYSDNLGTLFLKK